MTALRTLPTGARALCALSREWLPALVVAATLAACTASDTKAPDAAKADAAAPAVVRKPIEAPAPVPSPAPAPPVVNVPADALYVCAVQRDGQWQQTAIEFAPKVGDLCKRHPEMGPCQYERNNCRARGGRVFAAGGVEITMQTEAEYDKKVMRTRFRAN
jgi:hypothetical protein